MARIHPFYRLLRFCLPALLALIPGGSCSKKIDSQKTNLMATVRVSLGSNNQQGNGPVGNPAVPSAIDRADISDDGRYIAFTSTAGNLVATDTNGKADVFLRDNLLRTTTLVSVNTLGTDSGDQASFSPSISGDGRYVAFVTTASNIAPGKGDGIQDIVVRDMVTKTTVLASRATGSIGVKSNGNCTGPRISKNGRYVVFSSRATNLDPADADSSPDIYRRDFGDPTGVTFATILISRATGAAGAKATGGGGNGCLNPDISRDGHIIVYESDASNLVTVSGEGGPIVAPFFSNIFMRDATANTTIRLSTAAPGGAGLDPDDSSNHPSISGDGNFVTYQSHAKNIVAKLDNNPDIYWRDVRTPVTAPAPEIISVHTSGVRAGSGCDFPMISEDGTIVVWDSNSSSLVDTDSNALRDVFLHDRSKGITSRVSVTTYGGQFDGQSLKPAISADMRYVVFYTEATNAGDLDTNGTSDFYLRGPPF